MWEIVSNPNYVADPKKGSIHNRGGAVDISLADSDGKELDMGTPFDFFGPEASHDFENLSEEVKENRKILRKIMTRSGFRIFESEWWHYNLKNCQKMKASSNFNGNVISLVFVAMKKVHKIMSGSYNDRPILISKLYV